MAAPSPNGCETRSRLRAVLTRAVAALFAAGWLVFPGFGLIDLSVTWDQSWPRVLEAGWGLFSTLIVGAAFLLVAFRPRSSTTAVAQLAVATISLGISAAVATEGRLVWLAALLAVQSAIVAALGHPARRRATEEEPGWRRAPRPLVVLATAGIVPWLAYALHMWELNRRDNPVDVTLGIDHFAVQGAVALALALLPVLAALRTDASLFVCACAGIGASYLGLVSLAAPHSAGGLTRGWSLAAIGWGLALAAAPFARGRHDA